MSGRFAGWDERTLGLAQEEYTTGLREAQCVELRARASAQALEAFELAIAELSLAGLGELEAPPSALVRRLEADARAHVRKPRSSWH
jgi:hypothetical protein